MLLIHLPDKPKDGSAPVITPPLGLWSMRANHPDVRVIDANVEMVPQCRVDVAGYSVMFPGHLEYLPQMRKRVKAEVEIMGGPTGGYTKVEGITSISGPGENYLKGGRVHFSQLNPPYFERGEMDMYWEEGKPFSAIPPLKRWMPIETSRGCPNMCGFCSIPFHWGKWEARPLDLINSYLKYLKKVHKVEEIIVIDDNVAVSIPRFLSIIELFKKHKMYWQISNGLYNRVLLDKGVIKALKKSRCRYISLPFEAGNQTSANLMNLGEKYLTFEEAHRVANEVRLLGIPASGQFIIGYPGETEVEVKATLQYANALPLGQRHIHIAMPLAHTPMYRKAKDNGWLKEEGKNYKTPVIETPWLSKDRLYQLWKEDRERALSRKEHA